MNTAIRALIFFTVLYVRPHWGYFEEVTAFFGMCALVACMLFTNPRRKVSFLFPFLFLILTTCQGFLVQKINVRLVYMNVFVGIVCLKLMAERIKFTPKSLGKYLSVLMAIVTFVLIIQKTTYPLFVTLVYPEAYSTLLLSWVMGSIAVISVPFICKYKPLFLLACVFPVLYSDSVLCVALFLTATVFSLVKSKEYMLLCLGLAFIGVVFYLIQWNGPVDSNRLHVWKQVWKYAPNWIFGSGPGTFAHMGFLNFNSGHSYIKWLLNEPYQIWFEHGFVGLFIFALYAFYLLVQQERCLRVALFSIIGLSLFHPIFHSGKLVPLIITVVALAEKNIAVEEQDERTIYGASGQLRSLEQF